MAQLPILILLWFAFAAVTSAQSTLTVHHSANLRERSNTQSRVLDHFEAGDEVELVNGTARNGSYRVRTNEGIEIFKNGQWKEY